MLCRRSPLFPLFACCVPALPSVLLGCSLMDESVGRSIDRSIDQSINQSSESTDGPARCGAVRCGAAQRSAGRTSFRLRFSLLLVRLESLLPVRHTRAVGLSVSRSVGRSVYKSKSVCLKVCLQVTHRPLPLSLPPPIYHHRRLPYPIPDSDLHHARPHPLSPLSSIQSTCFISTHDLPAFPPNSIRSSCDRPKKVHTGR